MKIEFTLSNYRCFPASRAAHVSLQKGFTAFLGTNNAGKSSLLKFFFEFRHLFGWLAQPSGALSGMISGASQGIPLNAVADPQEVFCNNNGEPLQIVMRLLPEGPSVLPSGHPVIEKVVITCTRTMNMTARFFLPNDTPLNAPNPDYRGEILHDSGQAKADLSWLFAAARDLQQTMYIGAFRNAINIGTKTDYFDIAVGQAFIERWRGWQTGTVKKESNAAIKLTQDIQRIFGFRDLRINASNDGQTLHLIINDRPYLLPEVGTGLAQFILVLANAAVRQPTYILIDEPELSLHPLLQSQFLTTLGQFAKEGVLFATHSYGLARAAADYRFTVRRITDGDSEVRPLAEVQSLPEFLGELSFTGYSEVGFEIILLVEGVTEIKTVQQFLAKYRKDHRVVPLSLGGGDFINGKRESELNELHRICPNIAALIDSEKSCETAALQPARRAFTASCSKLGIRCHVLERRATENYFTDAAIKRVLGPRFGALGAYDTLPTGWSKASNWRIASEMTKADLDATDLGQFLAGLGGN